MQLRLAASPAHPRSLTLGLWHGAAALVVALLAVAVIGPGRARAAGLPSTRLGTNMRVIVTGDTFLPRDLDTPQSHGLGLVRIQAEEGRDMDPIVGQLARARMRLYPILGLPCPPGTITCTAQTQIPPATAAAEMADYITAFARRYGPNGSFWAANPKLPYLPITRFEIGNEPNIRMIWVQDSTHLHWPDPSDGRYADMSAYAQVYAAARAALHRVDPTGVAVVGGLADSASYGVDIESDESLLAALPRGEVDAVGYHPWVYDVSDSLLRPDTERLRDWMDTHGFAGVPIDVNEFGACRSSTGTTNGQSCSHTQSSQTWGTAVAGYTRWALCAPWMHVANVQPFEWGALPDTADDIWLPLVSADGSLTAYGTGYLNTARSLTARGCPPHLNPGHAAPVNVGRPSIAGAPSSGSRLTGSPGQWRGSPAPTMSYQWERCDLGAANCSAIGGATARTYVLDDEDRGSRIVLWVTGSNAAGSATASSSPTGEIYPRGQAPPSSSTPRPRSMRLRIVRVRRAGRHVTVVIRHARRCGRIVVTIRRAGRRHRAHRLRVRRRTATSVTMRATAARGTWILLVRGVPARGFAKPRPLRRRIVIGAHRRRH